MKICIKFKMILGFREWILDLLSKSFMKKQSFKTQIIK